VSCEAGDEAKVSKEAGIMMLLPHTSRHDGDALNVRKILPSMTAGEAWIWSPRDDLRLPVP